jgi:thiol-disulfide isomerase/thioredoxin
MNVRIAVIFAFVALAAAALGVYLAGREPQSKLPFPHTMAPKPVPQLAFDDAKGVAHTLAEFRGKVVLLNIWATWCAPCREEMPALDRLQAELGGERFQVIPISVDVQGAGIGRKFYTDVGIKALPLYVDPTAKAAFTLDAAGLPATLLLDRDGREIGRHLGAVKWDSPEVVEDLRRKIAGE